MKVLVVGSGGREHALCWAIAKSPECKALYCAPGNAGIGRIARPLPVAAEDIDGILDIVGDNDIDFVVVGPEGPLVLGLVDRLADAGVKAFGPTAAGARLEGSKGWTKDLCAKYSIPTAEYARFNEPDAAKDYIRVKGAPIVVKADGLAQGKGVILCRNENEAYAAIDHIMIEDAFKGAGAEVVIEEMLEGEEVSFFALVDGEHALPLVAAQDHKTAFDGDQGPNTGGMGAYTPTPIVTDTLARRIMDEIITPTIRGSAHDGNPYKGVLYAGLMMTRDGPKLIEYNVRFGDPECQPMVMRLKSDLLEALIACADGTLKGMTLEWRPEAALSVVMAAQGYPGHYEKGSEIRGLEKAGAIQDVMVFHAGTREEAGRILANGGRVLNVTALGETVKEAHKRAYQAVDLIDWPEGFCRRDIGWRAIDR